MNPEEVTPRNFSKHIVIYNDGDFSVVYGEHEDGGRHIAMRWNGDEGNPSGYPKTFNHPVWFFLPNHGNWVLEMLFAIDRINPQARIAELNRRLDSL